MLPPRSNLRRYICEGADLVTMSGGKMIHGPQGTGLLFGRADLVAAAQANNNPNHAVGRSDKVSREDLVGLYTALKLYMSSDEDAVLASYARELEPIVRALAGIPGLAVSIEHDQFRYHVPTAVIRFGPRWKGPSPEQVTTALFEGSPRVYVVYDRSLAELQISPVSLQAGEAALVARRLRQELT
jgi:L-seryl-tRNA(Ser) seleniumtransferase